ncbi:serine hydrolase domain-containing protein [Longimicrobium sp.]|uniref:serine hydrolase domain-containing protein n=1 Tax=Longimicrobium sp. TaxID=2029185 RepID=UPI003B3A8E48
MYRLPILACAALCIGALPAAAQQPMNDSTRVALNRVFAAWSAADGPGCAVGVSRGGILVFQNGYGLANLETESPITPASVFHVASVSKQFTAAAVMLLARDGKLSLEDDVRRHLPELPDYGHRITLRHLLTHTSGLRDQWDLLSMARGRFEENRITEDDVLEIVARQKALNFVPGTEYLYSNTGYTLAAVVVRRVSGKSLREFADERIFKPLGMGDTHFHDDYTEVVKGRAAGYARRPAGGWRVSLPNYDTYGATSLFTTVGDLLKWDANLFTPRVGDEGMWREMMASAVVAGGDTTGYGLGIATEEYRGARLVGHGGADAGYRTYLGRFPEHNLSVALLCNAAQANPSALTRSVADVLLGDRLVPAPAPPTARATLAPEELSALEGVYVHPVTGGPFFITRRGDTLVAGRTNGPALLPMGERRFRVGTQPVELEFTPDGGLVQTVLAWPRRTPVTLRRQERSQPSRAQLEAYAGTWYSEELGATYTVVATDSTLVLRTRGGAERTVYPAYGDTFAGDFLLAFTRGRGGRVEVMRMSSGRTRGVRFERVRR